MNAEYFYKDYISEEGEKVFESIANQHKCTTLMTKKILPMKKTDSIPEDDDWKYSYIALFKFFKRELLVLSLFSVPPRLILTRSPQISGQNKSEAREPEGLVKITYGIVASSLFKRVGNSNKETILNSACQKNSWNKMNQFQGIL